MLERFSCIKNGGLEIYSKNYFNSPFALDSQLLAGFFYAIQSISEEMKNPVSSIKLQNSLVFLRTYSEFILVLMFNAIPNELEVQKSFEKLAMLVVENYSLLEAQNLPQSFNEIVENILSPFNTPGSTKFQENDEKINRIAILGMSKAGKTSIKGKFFNNYSTEQLKSIRPTLGIEFSKNLINCLQESIIVMDFGGQNSYRNKYLQEKNNWIILAAIIFVVDIQDKNLFNDSLNYLNKIWENITNYNIKLPSLTIFLHKYDKSLQNKLKTNIQEFLILFKNHIKNSAFFLTSVDDASSNIALIKCLFLSLPFLVIKQILESFLIEMFQENILKKISELNINSSDSHKLQLAGESIGEELSIEFQKRWLEYYLGNFQIPVQQLNTKKVYISQIGNDMILEIDNWEKNGVSSEITNQFLTGFLRGIFKSLYVSSSISLEDNKISTKWKLNISPSP